MSNTTKCDPLNTNEIIPDHEFYDRLINDNAIMDFNSNSEQKSEVNETPFLEKEIIAL